MIRTYSIAAVAALAAVAGGAVWYVTNDGGDRFAGCRASAVAGGSAAIGGPFTLVSAQTGQTVTDADVITKPSLVYFGYTFCPDVCPLDAARNAAAADLLAERGYDVQPVFITIDPARDTPEVLAEFTGYMHPEMIGLTGTPDQIRAASQAYKTYYARRGDDPDYYLMDHSVFTYLMLPGSGFAEFFRGAPGGPGEGVTEEQVANVTACFIDAAS